MATSTKTPARKPAAKAPTTRAATTRTATTRAPAAKTAARASTAKTTTRAAAKPAVKKAAPITEKYTKTQVVNSLVESTELTRKQVNDVLDGLSDIIGRHLAKRGVGEFTMPGLLKIKTVKKPARRARKGINPFTGEETVFKAKPASTSVKILALKKLKDMAN